MANDTHVLRLSLIYAVLGPKWGDAALPFQVLAVGTLCRASYKVSDSLTRAVGAVYRRAWRQWIYAALVIGGAVAGQHWGIAGIAALSVAACGSARALMQVLCFVTKDDSGMLDHTIGVQQPTPKDGYFQPRKLATQANIPIGRHTQYIVVEEYQ